MNTSIKGRTATRVSCTDLYLRVRDTYNGRRRKFELAHSFSVRLYDGESDTPFYAIMVPAGYQTDLASIPLIATPIVGDRACFAEESVVHDWLCDQGSSPFYAHSIMRMIMHARKHPRWKCWAIFYALMFFGYGSFVYRTCARVAKSFRRK
jgi:hypothetical protein